MYQTIQAPQARLTFPLQRLIKRLAALWAAHQARKREKDVVRHLRRFDAHMVRDIDLDAEALWQPRPEIRQLQSGLMIAAGCRSPGGR